MKKWILTKISILIKIRLFEQKLDLEQKNGFLTTISIFDIEQSLDFWEEFRYLAKFGFLSKISIFIKIWIFEQKFDYEKKLDS